MKKKPDTPVLRFKTVFASLFTCRPASQPLRFLWKPQNMAFKAGGFWESCGCCESWLAMLDEGFTDPTDE
ncbi:MAG: hypothetical protein RMH74_07840 [Candidatus Caldarchaeum sp.]|nr:hypothetical protein [Candidatus Caldarchaeum sp.]